MSALIAKRRSRPVMMLLAGCLMLIGSHGRAADVSALTSGRAALLGYAYNSDKQEFVGNACVTGTSATSGVQSSSFSFEQSLSEAETKEFLGFGASGRARFGLTTASASAKFMRNATSTQYALSAIWMSDYLMPAEKLATNVVRSAIGNSVSGNSERWRQTCGQEYVEELVRGARLFFSIRVEFSSRERKQQFEARFNISGSVASAQANLDQASREFSRDAKVVISARQVGGDVSKLTAIFGTPEAANNGFVECSLGVNFAQCAGVIRRAIEYASDTRAGFPSQIAPGASPGPAAMIYRTAPYSAVGIYEQVNPLLDAANREARRRLVSYFDEQFALQVLAEQLRKLADLGRERIEAIDRQRAVVDDNLRKILDAADICFDRVDRCDATVRALHLQDVDKQALELPPLPKASFRLFTTSRGLWSRSDSVDWFVNESGSARLTSQGRPRDLLDLGLDEGASMVLLVEGVALKEAAVCFETAKVGSVPLQRTPGGFAEKVGPGYSFLVVQSTRTISGWQDIDLLTATLKAQSKFRDADGFFYVLVKDEFGRTVRFNVQYAKWRTGPGPIRGMSTLELTYRNRFWDRGSGGAETSAGGNWTEGGTASYPLGPPPMENRLPPC